jgi:hypothetical protein
MTSSTLSRIGVPSGTWRVDRAHTRVGFAVKQLGISTVRGEFREFDGGLEIGEDLANARAYPSTPTWPGAMRTCARRPFSPPIAIPS